MSVCLESWDIIDKDAHVIRVIHVYIVPWRPISGMICSPNWGLHPPKCQWPTIGPMESLGPSELQFKGIQNSAWFLCEVPFTQPRWFPGVHHLLLIINQYSIYHPDSWPTGFQKKIVIHKSEHPVHLCGLSSFFKPPRSLISAGAFIKSRQFCSWPSKGWESILILIGAAPFSDKPIGLMSCRSFMIS